MSNLVETNNKDEITCENFYDKVISDNYNVTVFLQNGVRLQGRILNHTDKAFMMTQLEKSTDKKLPQLVHKHCVATIVPERIPAR